MLQFGFLLSYGVIIFKVVGFTLPNESVYKVVNSQEIQTKRYNVIVAVTE